MAGLFFFLTTILGTRTITTVNHSENLINDALLRAAKAGVGEVSTIIGNTVQPKDFEFPSVRQN